MNTIGAPVTPALSAPHRRCGSGLADVPNRDAAGRSRGPATGPVPGGPGARAGLWPVTP
jgi:hypothetical protein